MHIPRSIVADEDGAGRMRKTDSRATFLHSTTNKDGRSPHHLEEEGTQCHTMVISQEIIY